MSITSKNGCSSRLLGTIGMGGVLALLLVGCGGEGSADTPEPDGDTAAVAESAVPDSNTPHSGADFVQAFEAEGLECEELDSADLREGVVQQFNCTGDDYLITAVRDYGDADARDQQLSVIGDMACEIAETGQDIQRVTVADTWIVMPGGDREVDFEVFGNAMTSLDLDWTDYTC